MFCCDLPVIGICSVWTLMLNYSYERLKSRTSPMAIMMKCIVLSFLFVYHFPENTLSLENVTVFSNDTDTKVTYMQNFTDTKVTKLSYNQNTTIADIDNHDDNGTFTTTTENPQTTIPECTRCVNGKNATQCVDLNETSCNCGEYYFGPLCQYINMNLTNSSTTKRTVNISWDDPLFDLGGDYSFAYIEEGGKSFQHQKGYQEEMTSEGWALVTKLQSGKVKYIICMIPDNEIEELKTWNGSEIKERMNKSNSDCIDVITEQSVFWYHEVAMGVVALLLGVAFIGTFIVDFAINRMKTMKQQGEKNKPKPKTLEKSVSFKNKENMKDEDILKAEGDISSKIDKESGDVKIDIEKMAPEYTTDTKDAPNKKDV